MKMVCTTINNNKIFMNVMRIKPRSVTRLVECILLSKLWVLVGYFVQNKNRGKIFPSSFRDFLINWSGVAVTIVIDNFMKQFRQFRKRVSLDYLEVHLETKDNRNRTGTWNQDCWSKIQTQEHILRLRATNENRERWSK